MTVTCARRNCGKAFDPDAQQQEECLYHSGAPVFHEGLKGWSCCTKRVVDFDEFMNIPGCTTGSHTIEAPVVPAPTKPAETPAASFVSSSDGVEVYGSAPLPSTQRAPIDTPAPKVEVVVEPEDDPEGTVVAIGTVCKRTGCGHVNNGIPEEESDTSCSYHPKEAIFHEGSKGYACCSRRVLEFSEFLKIKGCKTGRHRYLAAKPQQSDQQMVDCRFDWYQTQTHVIVSFFAKKLDKTASSIKFEPNKLIVNLVFQDGKFFQKEYVTFQPIQPEQSSAEFLSVKVEVNMRKGNGITWAALEHTTEEIKVWTTFGTTGKVGTVGAKDYAVAGDAAIFAQKIENK